MASPPTRSDPGQSTPDDIAARNAPGVPVRRSRTSIRRWIGCARVAAIGAGHRTYELDLGHQTCWPSSQARVHANPEVFAALAADWRALLREGEETNTVPFFLTGYGDVMARAAALAQIEDLPEDMRRFTDTMLAEHEGHLARDREVRGLVECVRDHWRRWPELGWAASSQGLPVEELPDVHTPKSGRGDH